MERLQGLQGNQQFWHKSMFVYEYLLKQCLEISSGWIMVIEDDVIGKEGWYTQAMELLREIPMRMKCLGWLYLRLFYNENLFGWNSHSAVPGLVNTGLCAHRNNFDHQPELFTSPAQAPVQSSHWHRLLLLFTIYNTTLLHGWPGLYATSTIWGAENGEIRVLFSGPHISSTDCTASDRHRQA